MIQCVNKEALLNSDYEVHDHLGNVRQVYGDARYFGNNGSNAEAGLTLKEQSSYYPFGMQIASLSYSREDYTFGMQGMIRDDEMKGAGNSISFKYRDYDPRIGRMKSVDPLASKAPAWTPYRAFFNNPLTYIDPDGLFEIKTGKIEKGDNLTDITKEINEKFGTKLAIEQIAKANNIEDANKIFEGNYIKLPGADVELSFDLESLKVTDANYSVDMPGLEWEGTSGREGYQSSEFQKTKDKGPLPEGQYKVDRARTQAISDIGTWDRTKGIFGRGTWPGLEKSWGEYRTWLTPLEGTNTYGRSGFTIHGGAVPGSAGCIDLTSRNNSFHRWLKSHSKPLILNVGY